jgi:hypothetical protein
LCFALAALAAASVASAQVVHDDFFGDVDTSDNTVTGGGTGFNNGEWFEYPQPTGPTWWNQWFFNNERIEGSKRIEYDIQLTQLEPFPLDPTIEVVINWSGRNWTDPGTPPIPDASANPDEFIVRESIFTGVVGEEPLALSNLGDPIIIPDFNPIWVSIDVRTIDPGDPGGSPIVQLTGEIWHEHIPEPSTGLMGLVMAAVVGYWLRRRNFRG